MLPHILHQLSLLLIMRPFLFLKMLLVATVALSLMSMRPAACEARRKTKSDEQKQVVVRVTAFKAKSLQYMCFHQRDTLCLILYY